MVSFADEFRVFADAGGFCWSLTRFSQKREDTESRGTWDSLCSCTRLYDFSVFVIHTQYCDAVVDY
jgi:hypothetical protein